MSLLYSILGIILVSVSIVLLILAWDSYRKRTEKLHLYTFFLIISVFFWCLGAGMEFLSTPIWAKVFWSKISYLGIASTATLWLILVLRYLKYDKFTNSIYIGLLMIWPTIVVLMAFTNEWHGLIWPYITPVSNTPGDLLVYGHGPVFWGINIYSFSIILLGLVFLITDIIKSGQNRAKVYILIFSGLIPILFNLIYVNNLIPVLGLDITPLGLTISVVLILIGIFKFNLLNIHQIASTLIFKSMKTGVMVFDINDKLLNLNSAANMIGVDQEMIGKNVSNVLAELPILEALYNKSDADEEIYLPKPVPGWFQARVTPIFNEQDTHIGSLLTINNISERKKAEEKLKKRDSLLEGVANMTKLLITEPELDKAMKSALAIIGNATTIDRCYIFKNSKNSSGSLVMNQRFEWINGKVNSEIDNPKLQNLPYESLNSQLLDNLRNNQPFYSATSELDDFTRKLLEDQEILSILLVPLTVKKSFWGFIGFDNCTIKRNWKKYEVAILKTAADSIASAIGREEAERALTISEHKSETILQAIPDMMFIINRDGIYKDFESKSEDLLAIKPDKLVGSHISKIGLSKEALGMAFNKITKSLDEGTIESFEYKLKLPIGIRYFEARLMKLDDNEVLSIVRDITDRINSENVINDSLKEKEVLLREIHHRVKNNMQVIYSLLNLQIRNVSGEESREVLKDSQGRVMSMAMIHEKLYQSPDLTKINFKLYIEKLVKQLFYLYGADEENINILFEIDEVEMNVDTAIPCGLIINELVTNSLKYAFPKSKGNLKIELKEDPKKYYTLSVSDDGMGLPPHITPEKTDTLGLQLVNSLVSQIDGSLQMDITQGTKFIITFHEVEYLERI